MTGEACLAFRILRDGEKVLWVSDMPVCCVLACWSLPQMTRTRGTCTHATLEEQLQWRFLENDGDFV